MTDILGAGTLGTVTTTDGADGFVQILVCIKDDNCKAWYRPVDRNDDDRFWTYIGGTVNLGDDATTDPNRVRFGQGTSSETYFRLVCYSNAEYTGEQLTSFTNPDDLLGRAYSPRPVYVDDGVYIQAVDGPTFRNDEWEVSTQYTHGIANLHPEVSPSPRHGWRSLDDQEDVEIVWNWNSATWPMGLLLGVGLFNCNFGEAELWGKNAGGSWVQLADISFKAATALSWTRSGKVVRPNVPGLLSEIPYYLPENILAGSHLHIDGKIRTIQRNSAGIWNPSTGSKDTTILLEDIDGTEGSSGNDGQVWTKDVVTYVPIASAFSAFKLVIPAQDTAEGFFTIGSAVLGHVFPVAGFAMGYGWGRGQDWSFDYELTEGRTGVRQVKALGPTRRAVEFAWSDGVETSDIGREDPLPDSVRGWTNGVPIAVPAGLPYDVPGLFDALQGACTPIVYLASLEVPSSSTDDISVTNRATFFYGRVRTETLKIDTVLGEEWTSELLRIGTVRIEEET